MKVTWLGQAGLMFETGGRTILVDPYLSDSVAATEPHNRRRVPADERFLQVVPDVVVCTHNHGDHADKETLKHYFSRTSAALCLAPASVWEWVHAFGGLNNTYVAFNAGSEWTYETVRFRAVCAEHSDPYAIGVILETEGKRYYVTGDTLYSERVFSGLPDGPVYAVFLPVNGRGNNMNVTDAARFAARVGAEYAVPLHVGLFDDLSAEAFVFPGRILPEIYREIVFPG